MAQAAHIANAARLREIAYEIEALADAVEQPSRSIERSSRLIAEGERLAQATRAVFRGGSLQYGPDLQVSDRFR